MRLRVWMVSAAGGPWSRFISWLAWAATVAGLPGCASLPPVDFGAYSDRVEVADTPFYSQQRYQCGPAALQTVLEQSGAETTLDELVDAVYLPEREGSLQAELVAAARGAGRIPYPLKPSLTSIVDELNAGRPVLVLQNLGVNWAPRWHYAAVFAVNPATETVYLRSGTDRERATAAKTFLRTWRRSDYWAIVVLRPGQLPANADPGDYFAAVAAVEETGHLEAAAAAWKVAAEHWPASRLPLFGLANVNLALGDYIAADTLYRELLRRDPRDLAAQNNLAYALVGQGREADARLLLESALASPDLSSGMRRELLDSLHAIEGE
jgi:tetratricopeptide (TPR) repeat protein